MRPALSLSLSLVLLLPACALGQASTRTDEEILAQAEAAFRQGVENKSQLLAARKHFSVAADSYRELHRRGIRSAALCRNLGNAAVLADRWPEAIWAYQVGLRLDPNDSALREQLAMARAKVLYPPAGQGRLEPETWPEWLRRPKLFEVSCVLMAAYCLAWIAATAAFLWRTSALYFLTAITALTAGAYGAAWWHEYAQAEVDRQTPLVVLIENADFHRGNGASYPKHPVLPQLPRGLEVRQLHRRGSWLHVRLTTGEIGWVHADQALVVDP
ncbi:MAG: hypothetical protein HYR84_00395 [Planctomycetes bacterium]|nr:hypothetical protein [Planctomycetota bacterium]